MILTIHKSPGRIKNFKIKRSLFQEQKQFLLIFVTLCKNSWASDEAELIFIVPPIVLFKINNIFIIFNLKVEIHIRSSEPMKCHKLVLQNLRHFKKNAFLDMVIIYCQRSTNPIKISKKNLYTFNAAVLINHRHGDLK